MNGDDLGTLMYAKSYDAGNQTVKSMITVQQFGKVASYNKLKMRILLFGMANIR